jgi:hypothetical protein
LITADDVILAGLFLRLDKERAGLMPALSFGYIIQGAIFSEELVVILQHIVFLRSLHIHLGHFSLTIPFFV